MYDSLTMSVHEDSFIPEPRHDILVEVIRTKEHDGRVRGVGDDIGLRVWFGTYRKSYVQVQKETLEYFKRELKCQKKDFEDVLAMEWESRRKDIKE